MLREADADIPINNKKKPLKDMIEDALRRAPPIKPPDIEQITKAMQDPWELPRCSREPLTVRPHRFSK